MSFLRSRKNYPGKQFHTKLGTELATGGYGIVSDIAEYEEDALLGPILRAGSHEKVVKAFVSMSHKPRDRQKLKEVADKEYNMAALTPHLHVKEPIEFAGGYYLPMRKMPGNDLQNVISDLRELKLTLTAEQYIRLSIALLNALQQQIHEVGLIHRDIKPDNIKVDLSNPDYPIVNILDPGLAKISTDIDQRLCGTLGYFSPESLAGHHTTRRSDVYSLGVCLKELYDDDTSVTREIVLGGGMFQIGFYPALNDVQDDLEHLIEGMCKEQRRDRLGVDEAREELERIRLTLKKRGLDTAHQQDLEQAHQAAKGARVKTIAEITLVIIQARFSDEQMAIEEFIETLGVRALHGCRTKTAMLDTIRKIELEHEAQSSRLEKIFNNINAFCEKYNTSKLFTEELLGDSLKEQRDFISRKLNKYANKQFTSLDDKVHATTRMREIIKEFPATLEMLVKKRCYLMAERIDKVNANSPLKSVLIELRINDNTDNEELEKLKRLIKAAISQYIHDTAIDSNIRGYQRAGSYTRVSEMNYILDAVHKSKNRKELRNAVKDRMSSIKTGFFGFGGSKLKNRLKSALDIEKSLCPAKKWFSC
jgi:serine/threonine protein kinase